MSLSRRKHTKNTTFSFYYMHGKLYHHIFSGTSSLQKVSSIVPTNKRICVELTNKRDTGAGGNPSSPDSQKNKKKTCSSLHISRIKWPDIHTLVTEKTSRLRRYMFTEDL